METYTKSSPGGLVVSCKTTTIEDEVKVAIGTGEVKTPYAWTNSLNGYKNPKWRDQVRKRQPATTPVSGIERSAGGKKCRAWIELHDSAPLAGNPRLRSHYVEGYPCNHYGFQDATFSDPTVEGRAATGFRKKCGTIRQEFAGGVFLGELAETLKLIRNPAQALRNGIDSYLYALKERRRRSRAQNIRVLADTWLEYSFGWRPLMSDIDDALRLLAFRKSRELFADDYVTVQFTAKAERASAAFEYYQPTGCRAYFWNDLRRIQTHSVRYKGVMKVEVPPENRIDAKTLGVSFGDFIPTAWEVLPWSFLIDYFTNIGDVIQAWSTCLSGLQWVQKTDRKTNRLRTNFGFDWVKTKQTYGQPAFPNTTISFETSDTGFLELLDKRFTRTPGGLVYPSIHFKLPGIGVKWINMAALLGTKTSWSKASYY